MHLLHYLTDELTPCLMYCTVKTLAVKTLTNIISIAKVFFRQFFQQRGFITLFCHQSFLLYGTYMKIGEVVYTNLLISPRIQAMIAKVHCLEAYMKDDLNI